MNFYELDLGFGSRLCVKNVLATPQHSS